MYQNKHSLLILGALLCLVLFGQLFTGPEAKASFSFTYTASDTMRSCMIGDQIQFLSLIQNTGDADSFIVILSELSPTPQDWWSQLCTGGICVDTTINRRTIYLGSQESDVTYIEAKPRSEGQGKWQVSVQSKGNSVIKTKTFLLHARAQAPVTSEWGLIILVLLIFTSATFLLYRKLKPVKQT
jgi:hypothetical protein